MEMLFLCLHNIVKAFDLPDAQNPFTHGSFPFLVMSPSTFETLACASFQVKAPSRAAAIHAFYQLLVCT